MYWAFLVKLPSGECHSTSLMISQHSFRNGLLGAVTVVRQQAITWANIDQVLWHHMVSLSLHKMTDVLQTDAFYWKKCLCSMMFMPMVSIDDKSASVLVNGLVPIRYMPLLEPMIRGWHISLPDGMGQVNLFWKIVSFESQTSKNFSYTKPWIMINIWNVITVSLGHSCNGWYLSYWPLGDVTVILNWRFSNSYRRWVSWAFPLTCLR